jgi:O-antigen/teichoic acid export membrane protein
VTGIGITTATAPPAPTPANHLAKGAFAGFGAELIVLPTGLITTAFLARNLEPADYGVFAVLTSLITLVCWIATSVLARTAVRIVSEAEDWEWVATTVLRWRASLGAALFVAFAVVALPLSSLLGNDDMAQYLRFFAIELLLFNISRAYREVLTARGRYHEIAIMSAVRLLARMVLIVTLILTVGGIEAAIAGSLLATILELLVARRYHKFGPARRPESRVRIWKTIGPLVLFGAATQLHTRLDLFVLSAFDTARVDVGAYGAAQNLASAPALIGFAFAPLLLSSLAGYRRDGLHDHARRFGSVALRCALCLVPFIGLVAAMSDSIVLVILGEEYALAGPLLILLFAASISLTVSTVCVAIAAADNKQPALVPIGFVVALGALAALMYVVPRWGTIGAAVVTLVSCATLGLACYALIDQEWRAASGRTFGRALLVAPFVYLTMMLVPLRSPLMVAMALLGGSAFIALALYGLGELQRSERTALTALVTQRWRNRPRRFLRRRN